MPQVRARSEGQTVAADQLLDMTNPRRLEEFRNQMMAGSSLAAAQTATQPVHFCHHSHRGLLWG